VSYHQVPTDQKKKEEAKHTQKENVDKYIVVKNGTETNCVFSIGLVYNTTRK